METAGNLRLARCRFELSPESGSMFIRQLGHLPDSGGKPSRRRRSFGVQAHAASPSTASAFSVAQRSSSRRGTRTSRPERTTRRSGWTWRSK
jgi:hypothetical protein